MNVTNVVTDTYTNQTDWSTWQGIPEIKPHTTIY